jgi:release factor glutamine methyltransferase
LKKGGALLFEIGHDQGEAVSDLMKDAGYVGVTVKKDYAGLDRVVYGIYEEEA